MSLGITMIFVLNVHLVVFPGHRPVLTPKFFFLVLPFFLKTESFKNLTKTMHVLRKLYITKFCLV